MSEGVFDNGSSESIHGPVDLNSEKKLVPRLEFHSNIQWAPAYQRNNKANGQKNLRCFPNHCQGLGHQRGFCGHSIVTNFYYRPEETSENLFSFAHFCIDDCDIDSPAAQSAKGVCRRKFRAGDVIPADLIKSNLRGADNPLNEYVEGLELQDRRVDGDGVIRVNFEFNRNLKGWHYSFLGSKLTRNLYHNFRSYVMEALPATPEGEPERFRILAIVTSPKWKLFCRRRNRVGVLPSKQEQMLPSNVQREKKEQAARAEMEERKKQEEERQRQMQLRQQQMKFQDSSMLVRRIKKRRDTTPPQIASFDAYGSVSGSNNGKNSPRRFSSCPTSNTASFFDLPVSSSLEMSSSFLMPHHPHHHQNPYDSSSSSTSSSSSSPMSGQNNRENDTLAGNTQSMTPEPKMKTYTRRLNSQKRLGLTGRSGQTQKRTNAGDLEELTLGASNQWAQCFNNEPSKGLVHCQSIPRLSFEGLSPFGKVLGSTNNLIASSSSSSSSSTSTSASTSPHGPLPPPPAMTMVSIRYPQVTDPRQQSLLVLMQMIDMSLENYDVTKALNLLEHDKFHNFVNHVSELLNHFSRPLPLQAMQTKKERGSEKMIYHMDELNFSRYLLKKKSFANKLIEFAKSRSFEQRKSDPYGTISFILQLLKEQLNAFYTLVEKHGSKNKHAKAKANSSSSSSNNNNTKISGSPNNHNPFQSQMLMEQQFNTQPHFHARHLPHIVLNQRSIPDTDVGSLQPCLSSLSLKDYYGPASPRSLKPDHIDLEKFTQELDSLACSTTENHDRANNIYSSTSSSSSSSSSNGNLATPKKDRVASLCKALSAKKSLGGFDPSKTSCSNLLDARFGSFANSAFLSNLNPGSSFHQYKLGGRKGSVLSFGFSSMFFKDKQAEDQMQDLESFLKNEQVQEVEEVNV